jgi:methylglyoxal synthase
MNHSNYFKNIKRIAIVAYSDARKDLIEWSYANKNILGEHIIISTARTATILEGTLNVPVLNLRHGRSGGYQQIEDLLEEKKIDIILFFGNPPQDEYRDSWFEELINVAIRQDVVVAYNQATIDMVLTSIAINNEINTPENTIHGCLMNHVSKEIEATKFPGNSIA